MPAVLQRVVLKWATPALNPFSGFDFPLFSMVLPRKTANRVENTGRKWKQNCCKVLQVYILFLF